jgi:hypothetical protein
MKVKDIRKFCAVFGLDPAFALPHPFTDEARVITITFKGQSLRRVGVRKNSAKFEYHALVFLWSDLCFAIEIEQKIIVNG